MEAEPERATRVSHQPPEVMKVSEVAELLRVDRKTVYSMIQRRRLPGVRRVGRCVRISRSALLAWLADAESSH